MYDENTENLRNRVSVLLLSISFIEDVIAEGDKVATRYTNHGTHQQELMGIPPTGKQMTVRGIVITRFADGKAVEVWNNADDLGMVQWPGGLLGNHQDKITDESSDGIATMDRAHKQFVQDRMLQSYTFLLCNNRLIRRLRH